MDVGERNLAASVLERLCAAVGFFRCVDQGEDTLSCNTHRGKGGIEARQMLQRGHQQEHGGKEGDEFSNRQ